MTERSPAYLRRLRQAAALVPGPDAGTSIGKYRILREIARGAMGVVFEAEDSELRRPVAVKILREILHGDETLRNRFQREAQSAARLNHPNIVRVYDAGEEDGRLYLVMELVRGRPLSEILGARTFEVRPMLHLLEKVARGLGAAHEAGIVHRDVKPANILVPDSGEPKVGDFGLAHWMDAGTALTKSGTPLGTPMYMAPEQVRGEGRPITPAADVFALGAILYEILTGRPPHVGESAMEIYGRIVGDDPVPPRRVSSRIPAEIETICLKALEKDPSRRYAHAGAFADDLRRHLDGESILAQPPGAMTRGTKWVRRHRVASVAASVGLLGLLAVVAVVTETRAERRRSAERHESEGREALERHRGLRERAAERGREARRLDGLRTDEARKALVLVQEELRALDREASAQADILVSAFTRALALDPGRPGSRSLLARFHFEEFERAERDGNVRAMEDSARQVRAHDDGTLAPGLRREGRVVVSADPAGATLEVLRFEESPDGRLLPVPVLPPGPLPAGTLKLPAGSYLLVLRYEGCAEARRPVVVRHGRDESVQVGLRAAEEVGEGFVHVSAGPFVLGGDPEAGSSLPADGEASTGDYFIARLEVTVAEYLDFLNGVSKSEGVEAAQARAPRYYDVQGMKFFWEPAGPGGSFRAPAWLDPETAVTGVSWEDAAAFCAWKGAREGGGVAYRLPTEKEWEKAARGADGRVFPWGNRFDVSFTQAFTPGQERMAPAPVGRRPEDASPYGVLDLAGNAAEWSADAADPSGMIRVFRGGEWRLHQPSMFRCAARNWIGRRGVNTGLGFRLVRVVERRK